MNRRTLAVLLSTAALVAGASPPAPSGAAGPDGTPAVRVLPVTGLQGGDSVLVRASGLPPSTDVLVVQCDVLGDPSASCPIATSATTSTQGTLRLRIVLADPVFRRQEVGRDQPVYCRADACRIGVVTRDEWGAEQLLAGSAALAFRGSPATIAASPATDLPASRWVRVTGTAHGATGRRVGVVEQACFELVQEEGCYAARPARWTRVRADGTFRLAYRVTSSLPGDGSPVDCTASEEILGRCVLTATVLDRSGQPDHSFGFTPYGDPSATLSFASTR